LAHCHRLLSLNTDQINKQLFLMKFRSKKPPTFSTGLKPSIDMMANDDLHQVKLHFSTHHPTLKHQTRLEGFIIKDLLT
jgi:hypothetical protein